MEAEQVGLEAGRQATADQPAGGGDSWEYRLRKYLLLLATLVATVTYGAAFNPPGGVWQDADPAARRIAGDPIIRETNYRRYLAFFYSNATAFASSLVVIVLVLILAVLHERGSTSLAPLRALRVVMVLDLLSLMGAYAAGTFRDRLTQVYSILLLAGVVVYLAVHRALVAWRAGTAADGDGSAAAEKLRKVLMLLATFALSVTYLAGLSAPGGFWDHAEETFRPGRAVLKGGRHDARLKAFFVFNTTAFVASLLIVIILLEKKLCFSPNVRIFELYGFIAVTLVGLVGAYSAGSCREVDTTVYVNSLVGAVIVFILVQAAIVRFLWGEAMRNSCLRIKDKVLGCLPRARKLPCLGQSTQDASNGSAEQPQTQMIEQARSLVLLLATLAAAITYQAGLNPPGGLWQGDGVGAGGRRYMAGDPILLTTNPRRYKAFYYCNSAAFVASLVAIVLLRIKTLHRHNALEAAMILDLFGLIGAYAAGSCRDVRTSVCAMAIAGAVLLYVAFHVFVSKKLDHKDASSRGHDEASLAKEKKAAEMLEKRRKRLLLFAILAATITYQAGLTPPGGFLVKGDDVTRRQAGDPVLLNNYPRRYKAFFYCNSVSFMLSIALIILLAFPKMYRPAIRSHALAVCTAAGMACIMGAYAAGCTQHLKTSIYTIVLAAFVLIGVLAVVVFWLIHERQNDTDNKASNKDKKNKDEEERRIHGKRKYLMLLGILVASVTYQAGLAPPGGVWQSNLGGHAAGNPVMHDNRRPRYLAFFYCNSTSFVASVVVIVLLLPPPELLINKWQPAWWLGVMDFTIVLDLLGLLIAYAAGSSRSWKTAGYVSALVIAVLGYFVIHVLVSCVFRRGKGGSSGHCAEQKNEEGANGQVRPALTN